MAPVEAVDCDRTRPDAPRGSTQRTASQNDSTAPQITEGDIIRKIEESTGTEPRQFWGA